MRTATLSASLLATVIGLAPGAAPAQTYPNKSIRIIGPSSPGGGIDATGRILAAAFTQSLGQQVVLENRPGAGGLIVLAPAGTPKDIIAKLNAETVKAIANPRIAQQIANAGAEAVSNSPEEFAAYIKTELARWGKAVKATGLPQD